jgi:hypothetical protein
MAPDTAPADETAPPRIDHVSGALVAVMAGVVLGVGAQLGAAALLVAVAVTQAALALSWIIGTGLPGRIGAAILAVMAAAAADTVVSVWPHGQLGELLPVLGLLLPCAFVHQLTRGVVRNRVVESLSDIALLVVGVVALAAFPQLRHEQLPTHTTFAVVLALCAALVTGYLVDFLLPAPRFDPAVRRGLPAIVGGALVASLIVTLELGGDLDFGGGRALVLGAALGLLVGLLAVGTGFIQVATSLPRTARAVRLQPAFATLLPLALVAPLAYLLCLAIHS